MNIENFLRYDLKDLPFVALAIIIGFTVHEFAHAYTAYKFGDDTAHKEGRVTLNPAMHLDLFGFILIIIAGFGWARPVPVRASNFRNPRLMSVIVSAVGPLSNLILGIISVFILVFINKMGLLTEVSPQLKFALETFLGYMVSLNFMLFVFNLIPLPPLDGYRIVTEYLPLKTRYKLEQNAQWGMIIFLLMVFIPSFRAVTLDPILSWGNDLAEFFAHIAISLF